jgi:hypothetical protein
MCVAVTKTVNKGGRPATGNGKLKRIPLNVLPIFSFAMHARKHDKAAFDALNVALAELAKQHGIDVNQFVEAGKGGNEEA